MTRDKARREANQFYEGLLDPHIRMQWSEINKFHSSANGHEHGCMAEGYRPALWEVLKSHNLRNAYRPWTLYLNGEAISNFRTLYEAQHVAEEMEHGKVMRAVGAVHRNANQMPDSYATKLEAIRKQGETQDSKLAPPHYKTGIEGQWKNATHDEALHNDMDDDWDMQP